MEYIGTIFVALVCLVLGYVMGRIKGRKDCIKDLTAGYPMPEDAVLFNKGVEEGRRQEKEDNLAIIKDNINCAARCMGESTGYEEFPYWDGAHDMANAIRREIEKEEQKDE